MNFLSSVSRREREIGRKKFSTFEKRQRKVYSLLKLREEKEKFNIIYSYLREYKEKLSMLFFTFERRKRILKFFSPILRVERK